MSFDPSIDDISSSGFQRSCRSSLDGTSAASAADFSTLSVTPSHRYLSNNEEEEARSLSCASVISIDREKDRDKDKKRTTESAVVHCYPNPIPATPVVTSPVTPTYPPPPGAFDNTFHGMETEEKVQPSFPYISHRLPIENYFLIKKKKF